MQPSWLHRIPIFVFVYLYVWCISVCVYFLSLPVWWNKMNIKTKATPSKALHRVRLVRVASFLYTKADIWTFVALLEHSLSVQSWETKWHMAMLWHFEWRNFSSLSGDFLWTWAPLLQVRGLYLTKLEKLCRLAKNVTNDLRINNNDNE